MVEKGVGGRDNPVVAFQNALLEVLSPVYGTGRSSSSSAVHAVSQDSAHAGYHEEDSQAVGQGGDEPSSIVGVGSGRPRLASLFPAGP